MYAIVEIAGKQFRVSKNDKLKVPLLAVEAGKKVEFDQVLFFEDDKGQPQVGRPLVKDLKISATVVEHGRDKKIIVFKKKRRKGYQVKNGHRQGFSVIKIDDIGIVTPAQKAAPATQAKKDEAGKTAPKKETVKKSTPKKETVKKSAPKTTPKKDEKKSAAPKKETAPKAKKTTVKKKTAKPAEDKEA